MMHLRLTEYRPPGPQSVIVLIIAIYCSQSLFLLLFALNQRHRLSSRCDPFLVLSPSLKYFTLFRDFGTSSRFLKIYPLVRIINAVLMLFKCLSGKLRSHFLRHSEFISSMPWCFGQLRKCSSHVIVTFRLGRQRLIISGNKAFEDQVMLFPS
jgi:hypothetical protein